MKIKPGEAKAIKSGRQRCYKFVTQHNFLIDQNIIIIKTVDITFKEYIYLKITQIYAMKLNIHFHKLAQNAYSTRQLWSSKKSIKT